MLETIALIGASGALILVLFTLWQLKKLQKLLYVSLSFRQKLTNPAETYSNIFADRFVGVRKPEPEPEPIPEPIKSKTKKINPIFITLNELEEKTQELKNLLKADYNE